MPRNIDPLALSTFWDAELRVELASSQAALDFMRLHMCDGEDGLVQEMDLVSTAEWFRAHGGKISLWHLKC